MENNQIQSPIQVQPQNKRKGFKITLLILAAILLTGATSYGVYVWQRQEVARLQEKVVVFEAAANSSKPNSDPRPVTAKYLEIPEMGVKIKLSENIKDAYYQLYSDKAVSLKTHSLDVEKDCRESSLSTAAIMKVGKDDVDPLTEKKFSESPSGVIIGDYFYYIRHAQYACAENASNFDLLSKVSQAFTNASNSIEKL